MTRLRELRETQLMTQAELAERAGLTQATISFLETGKTRPQLRTVRKLAAALGVEPAALTDDKFGWDDEGLRAVGGGTR